MLSGPRKESLTGSIHGKVQVLDVAKASEYLADMILRDVFGQFLHHDLPTLLLARFPARGIVNSHFCAPWRTFEAGCSAVTPATVASSASALAARW